MVSRRIKHQSLKLCNICQSKCLTHIITVRGGFESKEAYSFLDEMTSDSQSTMSDSLNWYSDGNDEFVDDDDSLNEWRQDNF